jgi:hypothetical protein
MGRWFSGFSTGVVLGIAFGVVLGFFLFPYFFQPPPGTDQLTETERQTLIAKGSFIHVNPSDPIHYGKGDVSVYPGLVFLQGNFEVGPGPAFHVYLVPKANVRSAEDVTGSMFVDLGPLRAFKGSQKYAVPAGVDLSKYPSVVIWCREFSVLISPADLSFEKPS